MRCRILYLLLAVGILTPIAGNTVTVESTIPYTDNEKIKDAIDIASESYEVNKNLIAAIVYVESKFKKTAKNGSSVGLMQVHMKFHRKKFKGEDPYGVFSNVFVGTSILKDCLVKHKEVVKKALKCYNGGGDPEYTEKVLKVLPLARENLVFSL